MPENDNMNDNVQKLSQTPSQKPVAAPAVPTKKKAASTQKKTQNKPKRKVTAKTSVKTEPNKVKKTVTPKEDIMTTANKQMEQMMQEAGNAQKEAYDTFMKAGNTFMKGMEEIMKVSMSQAQKTAEKNSQNMKKIMACKTVNEYTELQTKTAQENYDEMMSGMTKLSELSVKVAGDCFAPVNDQLNKTIKKASESMAA